MPLEGGVLEYGNTDDGTTGSWGQVPPSAIDMPSWHLRRAFEDMGSSYALLWHVEADEATLKVVAGYTVDAWRTKRADGRTFESESRGQTLDKAGTAMVALALRTGREHFLHDAQDPESGFMRSDLAVEFGIQRIYFTPIRGTKCVLECGVPAVSRLEGQQLLATLKMRCDLAGAACKWPLLHPSTSG